MTCNTCKTPKCCKNLGHCDETLVARLRTLSQQFTMPIGNEAADKIESLLEIIEELEAETARLVYDIDSARE